MNPANQTGLRVVLRVISNALFRWHEISGFHFTPHLYSSVLYDESNDTYYTANAPQLVWSPNRDRPVRINATLQFIEYGNLILEDSDGTFVWSTNASRKYVFGLKLTESRNLVLFDRKDATNGSFNGQLIPAASTSSPQFMRLEHDGHLKVYQLGDSNWNAVVDLLTSQIRDAAFFAYHVGYDSKKGCLLLSEVLSLINNDGAVDNIAVFLKLHKYQSPTDSPQKKSRHVKIILGSSLGAFFGVFFMVAFCFFLLTKKQESEEFDEFFVDQVLGMPTIFSYEELRAMTSDFCKKLGKGGFGSVFQGTIIDGTNVAMKGLNGFGQVKKSFLAEVETIRNIHHVNLVRLIGFCVEKSYRLLGYEYMSNGSLDTWIFRRHQELTLGWQSGRKIIMDIAKGLAYLHEECRLKIFHLDIKPQNILLDEDFNVKISDFGLSKLIDKDQSQVVTMMRGTPGYLAPEWLSSIITKKVDVYSFGVVVLEMLCGRKNLDRSHLEEDMHLLGLFKRKAKEERLLDIVDKYNDDMQTHRAEVMEMMRVVVWCLQSDFSRRPSMSVIVKVLEGSVDVQSNLDYSFTTPVAPRAITVAGSFGKHDMDIWSLKELSSKQWQQSCSEAS
ncbi:hypothetical protein TEA_027249 [Camellia sinensis var. sinensis]|uniref:non-specific serine/threonine protein kinase n=1 Tax=Camellia sinensis var. sinensis TaxID=542762 RepID=A0A4S4DLF8_CAMSN|nr:hypothetical protein TEA_027249 [Camellia sinensis var. sinensis]